MKKLKFITCLCIFALVAGVIVMNSCTKENSAITETKENYDLSVKDGKINRLIKDFINKMEYLNENPSLKSGEEVPADSALWYLSATINYMHSFPNEFYLGFELDTSYLTVTKNSIGNIDLLELTTKFSEMKENVSSDYYNSAYDEKGLSFVDLTEISQNENEITLIIETATGNRGSNDPPQPGIEGPFIEGDNWWYGEDVGKCDEASGEGSDAAEKLYIEASNTIPDPTGYYYFVEPFVEIDIEGGDTDLRMPTDPVPADNHLDYYLFYASTEIGVCTDDTLCIEWTEMNHYFTRLKYLMYNKYLNQPGMENHGIMCILEFYDWNEGYTGTNNQYYIKYYHKGKLKFGRKVYYDEGEQYPEEL